MLLNLLSGAWRAHGPGAVSGEGGSAGIRSLEKLPLDTRGPNLTNLLGSLVGGATKLGGPGVVKPSSARRRRGRRRARSRRGARRRGRADAARRAVEADDSPPMIKSGSLACLARVILECFRRHFAKEIAGGSTSRPLLQELVLAHLLGKRDRLEASTKKVAANPELYQQLAKQLNQREKKAAAERTWGDQHLFATAANGNVKMKMSRKTASRRRPMATCTSSPAATAARRSGPRRLSPALRRRPPPRSPASCSRASTACRCAARAAGVAGRRRPAHAARRTARQRALRRHRSASPAARAAPQFCLKHRAETVWPNSDWTHGGIRFDDKGTRCGW